MLKQRPQTLQQIAHQIKDGREYHLAFKEFMDEFIKHPLLSMIKDEPELLDKAEYDVHLAGTAEYLAFWLKEEKPDWCDKPERFLREPFVAGGKHSMAYMMMETPFSFRRRMLFCGAVFQKLKAMHPTPITECNC